LSGSPRCRTSSSASSPVTFSRGPSDVSSVETDALMPSAVMTRSRNSVIGRVISFVMLPLVRRGFRLAAADPIVRRCLRLATADALQTPLSGRPHRPDVRRSDQVFRLILLPDRPDVGDDILDHPHVRQTSGADTDD